MPPTDEECAANAIAALADLSPAQRQAKSRIDAILASGDQDSHVDIHELFGLFDALYFESRLSAVELHWSTRLTLYRPRRCRSPARLTKARSAGICELAKDDAGDRSRIRIKLSAPLLQLRPRADVVATLLHECIHAYLFAATSLGHLRSPDGGHGPGFLALASAISSHSGVDISAFHAFHDEVDSLRTHVWLCSGPCRGRPPHFGVVRRSMNRAPGKNDPWWAAHERDCGGTYEKVAAPEPTKKQVAALSARERAGRQKSKIDAWVVKRPAGEAAADRKRPLDEEERPQPAKSRQVTCPVCDMSVREDDINAHLDRDHFQ
jgi:hypothetical protein